MVTDVSIDSLADAMVAQLAATMIPASGDPVSGTRPVYDVRRYMGGDLTTPELFKRGGAGRMPAVRIRHANTKSLRATLSRTSERVESTFQAIVATDNHRSKDSRKALLALAEAVRRYVGSRAFGLAVNPMHYVSTDTVRDDEQMMALAVGFRTRHRVSFTRDPGNERMESFDGQIVNADSTRSPKPNAPAVAMHGTPGVTRYAWALVGVGADGMRTLLSDSVATSVGPLNMSATDYARLSWAATPGMVSYEVHRVESFGPAAIGRIGSTALLSFSDIGQSVEEPTAADPFHVDIYEVFP